MRRVLGKKSGTEENPQSWCGEDAVRGDAMLCERIRLWGVPVEVFRVFVFADFPSAGCGLVDESLALLLLVCCKGMSGM